MTLLSLLKAATSGLQRYASERIAYQQLRQLDPYLLKDVGLRIEHNRVFPLHKSELLQPDALHIANKTPQSVSQHEVYHQDQVEESSG